MFVYKDAEDGSAIIPCSNKKRVSLIVIARCMFQHKPTVGLKEFFFHYFFRDLIDRVQGIGRAGEDEIELICTVYP